MKKKNWKKEIDFFTSTPIILNPKISFFIWKEGEGLFVPTERDVTQREVTQESSREQTRQSVMVGVGGSKKGNFSVT